MIRDPLPIILAECAELDPSGESGVTAFESTSLLAGAAGSRTQVISLDELLMDPNGAAALQRWRANDDDFLKLQASRLAILGVLDDARLHMTKPKTSERPALRVVTEEEEPMSVQSHFNELSARSQRLIDDAKEVVALTRHSRTIIRKRLGFPKASKEAT